MAKDSRVREVDSVAWMPDDLVLTWEDKQIGFTMLKRRYFSGIFAPSLDHPIMLDNQRNLDNTLFEVNTFLAELQHTSKG